MSLTADGEIANSTIRSVVARLKDGKAVVQNLPGGGTLNIDRLLPFLFIYRNDIDNPDKAAGTFVSSEASYLLAPGNVRRRKGLKRLIEAISQLATERFGAFLLLEIRTLPIQREQTDAKTGELQLPSPRFVIQVPSELPITASSLKCTLRRIVLYGRKAIVETDRDSRSLNCLLQRSFLDRQNVSFICVYIDPIYRNSKSDVTYDALLAELRRGVARALKRTSFSFVVERTNTNPQHYWVLGRRKLPQNVWDVDRQLAEVSSAFKFLVAVTPINAGRAWIEFRERKFSKTPKFQYSPLELDPLLLKRTLMNIRVDEVDDPTLAHVFRQTQDELDRQITMLADLDTPRFLYGSMQVFGVVESSLLKLAHQILRMPDDQQEAETVSASV